MANCAVKFHYLSMEPESGLDFLPLDVAGAFLQLNRLPALEMPHHSLDQISVGGGVAFHATKCSEWKEPVRQGARR